MFALQARFKLATSPLQAWIARPVLILIAVFAFNYAHAEDLPNANAGIKVEVVNKPEEWHSLGYTTRDNDIFVIYGGDLYDPDGTATKFKVVLRFDALGGYLVKEIGRKVFTPPIKTYLELGQEGDGLVVSADRIISIKYTLVDGSEQQVGGTVHILAASMVPDVDRDGTINQKDYGKVTEESPFRWWLNTNDEEQPDFNLRALPEQPEPDFEDMNANGVRDLVDFFPLKLDIAKLLEKFPAGEYRYILSHPAGAFKFIEMPELVPDSSPDGMGAGSYLRNRNIAMDAVGTDCKTATEEGGEISIPFLVACADGNGVLLLEAGLQTQAPLELILKEGDEEKIRFAMPVSPDEIKKMYRWVNLRAVTQGPVAEPTNLSQPANYPDAEASNKWFVFVHGYNVNEDSARSWNADVFKRLYRSGSNARYVGVTWYGDQGQLRLSTFGLDSRTPDYWKCVYNAFQAADALKQTVNSLSGGGKKIIAAHSLGNMVACSAIHDKGMAVSNYFLLNAAVATECFDDKTKYQPIGVNFNRMKMVRPDWKDATSWGIYDSKLYAAEYWWHFRTNKNDGRYGLSWNGRFRKVRTTQGLTVTNYWSRGETAAANSNGNLPRLFDAFLGQGAWVKQEMEKGRAAQMLGAGIGTGNWTATGGWGFEGGNPLNQPPGPEPAVTANTKQDDELRISPFCLKFKVFGGQSVHGTKGDVNASNVAKANQAWLLAHDVPALSPPAGGGAYLGFLGGNIDMQSLLTTAQNKPKWIHSDMVDRVYEETRKFYDSLVSNGKLKD